MQDPQKDLKTYFHFKRDSKLEIEVMQLPASLANIPHLFTPHRTNFNHVFIFRTSHLVHHVDFIPIKVEPYSILFIGKGQVHQFDELQKYDGYELIFTDEFYNITEQDLKFLKNYLLFNGFWNKQNLQFDKKSLLKYLSLIENIKAEIDFPGEMNKRIILKNLVQIFLLLIEREKLTDNAYVSSETRIPVFIHFMNLIEDEFKNNLSVSDYARLLNITERKLGIITKENFGKLPNEIIIERQLIEAKRLLIHGELTVKEIGYELGFTDPTNFGKFFKKYTDLTPLAFKFQSANKASLQKITI